MEPSSSETNSLDWIKRLQAIAQTGLTYARDPYDIERYTALREIAAEMLAAGSGLQLPIVRGLLEKDSGYATPKVDVRGVVFRADNILLVRERSDGKWTLPGGWADVCASPAENVVREVFEESGFHEPPFAFHVYKIFVLCDIVSGKETPSSETDSVGFFREADIPELSLTRITPAQVRRMFDHHSDSTLPTDFDAADEGFLFRRLAPLLTAS